MSAPTQIVDVFGWEALDSRGSPTVGCAVRLAGGATGSVVVPSGASTGRHEAHELRDGDAARYQGRGVRRAVTNVGGAVAAAVRGLDATDQQTLDAALIAADGTAHLQRLGANAVLGVSLATMLAAAAAQRMPLYRYAGQDAAPLLPLPMVNIISGGAHAAGAVDVQDFLVVPIGATTFAEAIEWAGTVRRCTAEVLAERGFSTALVADEGGLAPTLSSNREALEHLARGIDRSKLAPGQDVGIAIDVAATQLIDGAGYVLRAENRTCSTAELVDELAGWCAQFPILSIEDPVGEDDWTGWAMASNALGDRQLVGDDLFATDEARLARGIDAGVANAVLVKANQNGTVSGTRSVLRRAQTSGYATIVSARSGDTEDTWLADLAVGWRAGQIKVGSTTRSERTAKWNRLLQIEATLGPAAEYAGDTALRRG